MPQFAHLIRTVMLGLCCLQTAFASDFPKGCEVVGYAYQNANLLLNENGEQTLYLVQNHSEHKIELQRQESGDVFMSPPLQAKLEASNWAAFASDIANLHFSCRKIEESGASPVNCQEVLEVCQYPRVKFALSNMGNYWVSINKSQADVIHEATAKGIYLKW